MSDAGAAARKQSSHQNSAQSGHEFDLTDAQFNELRSIIKTMTGINMGEAKRELVYRRVSGRLKATGIRSFSDYLAHIKSGDENEIELFTNAVTTNLTSFFREKHHFDYLADTILPEVIAKKGMSTKRLRIWSAGCSTGEEPYSLAMTVKESMRCLSSWDARILCTDLDSDVLATCRAGIYPMQRVEKIPERQLKRWFEKSTYKNADAVKVRKDLQDLLVFKQLNLMQEWPMKGPFDVIFCRNVIIYFDKPTQRILMDRYASMLDEGGYLILGHSESLHNVTDRFELLGKTIYRKTH